MNRYLLRCSCGKTHVVDTAQAGTVVLCDCGNRLIVPSMRDLIEAQHRTEGASARGLVPVWGRRQAYLFVGTVITALGLIGCGWMWINKPWLPEIDDLSPVQTWILWQQLRQGPERHLSPSEQAFEDLRSHYLQKLTVMGLVTAIGVLFVLRGLFLPQLWKHHQSVAAGRFRHTAQ